MWFAALSSGESAARTNILERFKQLYEAAGKPEGVTLFGCVDSSGYFNGYAITDRAAELLPEMIEEFKPWYKTDRAPGHCGWEAGDGGPRR